MSGRMLDDCRRILRLLLSVHVLIAELHFELRRVGGYTRVPIGGVGMPPHTPAPRIEFCNKTVYKEPLSLPGPEPQEPQEPQGRMLRPAR